MKQQWRHLLLVERDNAPIIVARDGGAARRGVRSGELELRSSLRVDALAPPLEGAP